MATPAPALDPIDAKLVHLVQEEIPYDPRPFGVLGALVGIGEDDCLARIKGLRDERRIIRQISAIFDTKALGYASSLVTGRYAPARLDDAAAVISAHPGVSHNYKRNHSYNLWYTVAVPPDSRLGLEGTLDRLHALSGAECTRPLPTLKLYKIGVKLDVAGEGQPQGKGDKGKSFSQADRDRAKAYGLTEQDKRLILVLQRNLDLVARPFDAWAAELEMSVEDLLACCRRFEERKQMRRFSAVLHHREAGFKANVMGVWKVDPARADEYGAMMAKFQAVSHCYLRPTYEDWPYNIYTMVHGQTRQDAEAVLAEIQRETGLADYAALWSMKEYKKTRVEYFTPLTAAWEAAQGAGSEGSER